MLWRNSLLVVMQMQNGPGTCDHAGLVAIYVHLLLAYVQKAFLAIFQIVRIYFCAER